MQKFKFKFLIILTLIIGGFFRFFYLEYFPPGFYSDEASYAYNAYSILKTGNDEHGKRLPLVFEAFGDYKLPVMLYAIVGSFSIFSPSEWSARLPGAVFGLLSILGVYLFTAKLFATQADLQENNENKWIACVAAILVAISPSHIFVSRGTWELTPALCAIIFGSYFILIALNQVQQNTKLKFKGTIALLLAVVCYGMSLYAYNSARVFVPLLVISYALIFRKQVLMVLKNNKVTVAVSAILACIIIFPILRSITSPEVTQRAKYISIFYDKGVQAHLFDIIRADGGQSVLITRLLHNKPVLYFMNFAERYFSHFDPNFLFITGDTFEIFKLVGLGFMPLLAAPFLVYGGYKLCAGNLKWGKIIVPWLLISPISASLTIFTPSTSRAMNMIVPLCCISAYGIISFGKKYAKRWGSPFVWIFTSSLIAITIVNSAYIFMQYFSRTPVVVAEKWNDGYQETVEYVSKIEKNYDRIVVSSAQAPSYIFFAWNLRYDPKKYQQEARTDHTPDEHGLNFTEGFGKYYFTKDIKQAIAQKGQDEKVLYIGFPNEFDNFNRIVYSRNNKPAFILKE